MAIKRVEVHYSGNIQGVGFRFSAENFANAYKLVGYVRNLPDGRVELVAEGGENTLNRLLEAIRQDMGHLIVNYSIKWLTPTGEFKRFDIRF
jgi:acylphosphatase